MTDNIVLKIMEKLLFQKPDFWQDNCLNMKIIYCIIRKHIDIKSIISYTYIVQNLRIQYNL